MSWLPKDNWVVGFGHCSRGMGYILRSKNIHSTTTPINSKRRHTTGQIHQLAYVSGSKDGHPTFNGGNPYNGYINP